MEGLGDGGIEQKRNERRGGISYGHGHIVVIVGERGMEVEEDIEGIDGDGKNNIKKKLKTIYINCIFHPIFHSSLLQILSNHRLLLNPTLHFHVNVFVFSYFHNFTCVCLRAGSAFLSTI